MKRAPKKTLYANVAIVAAIAVVTDTKPGKGEDLIGDPKLKKAFKDAKKRAAKKKP